MAKCVSIPGQSEEHKLTWVEWALYLLQQKDHVQSDTIFLGQPHPKIENKVFNPITDGGSGEHFEVKRLVEHLKF